MCWFFSPKLFNYIKSSVNNKVFSAIGCNKWETDVQGFSLFVFRSPAFTVFLYQQSLMTLLVVDKSTISQSDNLWLIVCLLSRNTGEWYMFSDGIAISRASTPLWRSTLLGMWLIFLSPTTVIKAMQMDQRNKVQCGLSSNSYLPASQETNSR